LLYLDVVAAVLGTNTIQTKHQHIRRIILLMQRHNYQGDDEAGTQEEESEEEMREEWNDDSSVSISSLSSLSSPITDNQSKRKKSPSSLSHSRVFLTNDSLWLAVVVVVLFFMVAITVALSAGLDRTTVHYRNTNHHNHDNYLTTKHEEMDHYNHVCAEGKVEQLWTGIELELTLGGLSEPVSEENQRILKQAVQKAYNQISQHCKDPYERWMVDTPTLNYQELVPVHQSSLSLSSSTSSKIQEMNQQLQQPQQIVAHFELSISCKDCLEPQVFADIYPALFTSPVHENENKEDGDGTRRPHRWLVSRYHHPNGSTVIASTALSDRAESNQGQRRIITTDTNRNRKARGAATENDSTRTLQDNAKTSSEATITIEDGTIFLNAADVITLIEQTAVNLGFAPQQMFQGILEAAVGIRNGMRVAQMSRTSLPDDP
jgi:hypothetical protein